MCQIILGGNSNEKVLSALLSSAIIMSNVSALPFSANAAWKGQYEFEKGKIVNAGENGAEIMSVSGASGGKAVDIKDGGNTVSLMMNFPMFTDMAILHQRAILHPNSQ